MFMGKRKGKRKKGDKQEGLGSRVRSIGTWAQRSCGAKTCATYALSPDPRLKTLLGANLAWKK